MITALARLRGWKMITEGWKMITALRGEGRLTALSD